MAARDQSTARLRSAAGLWAGAIFLAAGIALPAQAQGIVFGPVARSNFESYVTSYGISFINFNALSAGTALDDEFLPSHGVTFASTIQTDGSAIVSPHNVYVSGTVTGHIVGTPSPGGSDDGRVGYRITFTVPQAEVGLVRNWQAGYSLTRFFNSSATLLGTHTNTANNEFVGYIANYSDPLTWPARIEIDGLSNLGTRQVGYSDDLFFGTAAIPEPSMAALVAGLLALGWRLRPRRTAGRAVDIEKKAVK